MKTKFNQIFVEIFDYYGSTISLNIAGKSKYKNVFNSIIGFGCFCAILIISLVIFLSFIRRDDISIIYNIDRSIVPNNEMSDLPFLFNIYNAYTKPIQFDGLFELSAKMLVYTTVMKANLERAMKVNIINVPLEKCANSSAVMNYKTYLKDVDLTKYYCMKEGYNKTLYSTFGDGINGFSLLNIYVDKCDKKKGGTISIPDNKITPCLPDDVIEKTLSNVYFNMLFLDNQIEHYNQVSPNKYVVRSLTFSVTSYLVKKYYLQFDEIKYNTDEGFIFKEETQKQFFLYKDYLADIFFSPGSHAARKNMAVISLRNSPEVSLYNRSYMKGQRVIADMGGISQAVLIIYKVITLIISRKSSMINIINDLFLFSDDTSSENKVNVDMTRKIDIDNSNNEMIINRGKTHIPILSKKLASSHMLNSVNNSNYLSNNNSNNLIKNDSNNLSNKNSNLTHKSPQKFVTSVKSSFSSKRIKGNDDSRVEKINRVNNINSYRDNVSINSIAKDNSINSITPKSRLGNSNEIAQTNLVTYGEKNLTVIDNPVKKSLFSNKNINIHYDPNENNNNPMNNPVNNLNVNVNYHRNSNPNISDKLSPQIK